MRQHNEKKAAIVAEADSVSEKEQKVDDELYEVSLDEDFLTALEYGMPPASGLVCLSNIECLVIFSALSNVFCLFILGTWN